MLAGDRVSKSMNPTSSKAKVGPGARSASISTNSGDNGRQNGHALAAARRSTGGWTPTLANMHLGGGGGLHGRRNGIGDRFERGLALTRRRHGLGRRVRRQRDLRLVDQVAVHVGPADDLIDRGVDPAVLLMRIPVGAKAHHRARIVRVGGQLRKDRGEQSVDRADTADRVDLVQHFSPGVVTVDALQVKGAQFLERHAIDVGWPGRLLCRHAGQHFTAQLALDPTNVTVRERADVDHPTRAGLHFLVALAEHPVAALEQPQQRLAAAGDDGGGAAFGDTARQLLQEIRGKAGFVAPDKIAHGSVLLFQVPVCNCFNAAVNCSTATVGSTTGAGSSVAAMVVSVLGGATRSASGIFTPCRLAAASVAAKVCSLRCQISSWLNPMLNSVLATVSSSTHWRCLVLALSRQPGTLPPCSR